MTADAGVADAGVTELGVTDAGVTELGVADAGVTELGVAGAGVTDPRGPAVAPERRRAALEAVLLISDVPVSTGVFADLLAVAPAVVEAELDALAADLDAHGHGFGLQKLAGGWLLTTRAEFAGLLERHLGGGQQVRLTTAAVEALTVVAYQQPVTRGHVSSVRGVASDGVLRTLVGRGMVEECGTDETGALRYRTTPLFLERIGLDSLDELPPLAPHLPDLAELETPAGAEFDQTPRETA
jgi:segregation and condensation protein B